MSQGARVAIVSGSSRGLGRATAVELARRGARVVVNYLRSEAEALHTVEQIQSLGSDAVAVRADVADRKQVDALVAQALARWGRVDVLVNNAGILRDRTLRKMSAAEWSDVLAVNLTGVFNCTQAVIDTMLEQRHGRIVSIASVVAESGGVGQTNYGASKAGIIGFTRSLALELAPKGITVNAVAPGFMRTDMLQSIPAAILESIRARIPAGDFGEPADVAAAVAFLASAEARYITGHVLDVNGGFYL